MLLITGDYNILKTSVSMPRGVDSQLPQLLRSNQTKPTQTPHSTHILKDLLPNLLKTQKMGGNQAAKRSSCKNQLKSARNNCFETLQLRAMLKKAKEVSASQTFLPPKTPRPFSGVTNKPARPEIRRNSRSDGRLALELSENLRQCHIQSNKCMKLPKDCEPQKLPKDAQNGLVQLPAEQMGSLSQIIFFGGQEQIEDMKIMLVKQSISKGGELQCRELLQQLSNAGSRS